MALQAEQASPALWLVVASSMLVDLEVQRALVEEGWLVLDCTCRSFLLVFR